MIELLRYQAEDKTEPVTEWLIGLRDKQAQAKLRVRLRRLESGNFGDCDTVGEGFFELREHVGAGYRIYLGRHGQKLVILLCGGDKKSQATAKRFWAIWKRRPL